MIKTQEVVIDMSLMDYERPSLTTDIVLMRIDERQSKNNRKNNEKIYN